MIAIVRSMAGLVFDAVIEESHDLELQVTDNPVESGVVVSDHAFMLPVRLTLRAGVTDSPIIDYVTDQFAGESRSLKAYALLTALQRNAEPFNVQTGLKLYKNMVCVGLKITQDKETSQAMLFTADLREVIIVNTQTVKYKSRKVTSNGQGGDAQTSNISGQGKTLTDKQAVPKPGAVSRQALPTVDRGEVKGNPVASERKSSLLYKIKHL